MTDPLDPAASRAALDRLIAFVEDFWLRAEPEMGVVTFVGSARQHYRAELEAAVREVGGVPPPVPTAEPLGLNALVLRWRRRVGAIEQRGQDDGTCCGALLDCANELEAAVARLRAAGAQPVAESLDLKLVLDAAQQHCNDSDVWKSVHGPAYFEANMNRAKHRGKLGEAIQRLRAAGAVPPPVTGALRDTPQPETHEEKTEARVASSHPCVAPAGSTAEPSPGAVTSAERLDAQLMRWGVSYDRWHAVKLGFVNVFLVELYRANVETEVAIRLERVLCQLAIDELPRLLSAKPDVGALRDTTPKSSRDTPHAYEPDVYQGSPCRVCRLEPNHHLHRMRREVGALRDTPQLRPPQAVLDLIRLQHERARGGHPMFSVEHWQHNAGPEWPEQPDDGSYEAFENCVHPICQWARGALRDTAGAPPPPDQDETNDEDQDPLSR